MNTTRIVTRWNANAGEAGVTFRAERWGLRRALIPTDGADNSDPPAVTTGATTDLGARFNNHVRVISLG